MRIESGKAMTEQHIMDDHWKRVMRQWLHRCPHSGVNLFIFGAAQLDEYSCRMCGKRFTLQHDANDTGAKSTSADHCKRSDQIV
jgi:hypothetical protein